MLFDLEGSARMFDITIVSAAAIWHTALMLAGWSVAVFVALAVVPPKLWGLTHERTKRRQS